jgi:hypothetical protein
MNVRSLLAVIVCLSGASVARAIPLYVQDFASGSTPQAYVSSTSTKNLLASLSSESAGGVWSIDATGALQLIRTSNTTANSGAGFTTLSLASTPPGMLSIKFDFGVKVSNSPTLNNAMRLEIGAIDSGDYNDKYVVRDDDVQSPQCGTASVEFPILHVSDANSALSRERGPSSDGVRDES